MHGKCKQWIHFSDETQNFIRDGTKILETKKRIPLFASLRFCWHADADASTGWLADRHEDPHGPKIFLCVICITHTGTYRTQNTVVELYIRRVHHANSHGMHTERRECSYLFATMDTDCGYMDGRSSENRKTKAKQNKLAAAAAVALEFLFPTNIYIFASDAHTQHTSDHWYVPLAIVGYVVYAAAAAAAHKNSLRFELCSVYCSLNGATMSRWDERYTIHTRPTSALPGSDSSSGSGSSERASGSKPMQVCSPFQCVIVFKHDTDTHRLQLKIQKSFYHQTLVNVHRRYTTSVRGTHNFCSFVRTFVCFASLEFSIFEFWVCEQLAVTGKFYVLACWMFGIDAIHLDWIGADIALCKQRTVCMIDRSK